MNQKIWKIIADVIIILSIFLFVLSFYQVKTYEENILAINQSVSNDETVVLVLVKLEYPKLILRNQKIRFHFELFKINTDALSESIKIVDKELYDLFKLQSINLESRLELPGIRIDPSGVVSQNLVENKNLYYEWDLYPFNQGVFQGTLWLYVNLIPVNPSEAPVHEILLAKPVQIEVITIFGLSAIWIKILSIIFLFFSFFLRFRIFSRKKKKEVNRTVELKIEH